MKFISGFWHYNGKRFRLFTTHLFSHWKGCVFNGLNLSHFRDCYSHLNLKGCKQ